MAYSCCFSLGGNLDFVDFHQKKFYKKFSLTDDGFANYGKIIIQNLIRQRVSTNIFCHEPRWGSRQACVRDIIAYDRYKMYAFISWSWCYKQNLSLNLCYTHLEHSYWLKFWNNQSECFKIQRQLIQMETFQLENVFKSDNSDHFIEVDLQQ